jgi:bifunctional non-homologous end joining protein LigD
MEIGQEHFTEMKVADESFAESIMEDTLQIIERKYDGTAAIAQLFPNNYSILGRGLLKDGSRQNYTDTFPDLASGINKFRSALSQLDRFYSITLAGEIVVLDANGNESFKGIESRCNRKKDIEKYAEVFPAQFMVFDILEYNGRNLLDVPFDTRRALLESLSPAFKTTDIIRLIKQEKTTFDKRKLYEDVISGEFGYEGVVIKDRAARYGKNVYKFKYQETQDVFWEGEYKEGKNRLAGKIGSLICYQYINGEKLHVASVGGGISDILRAELMEMVTSGRVSVETPAVLECKAYELLPTGAMRYPSFIRWRTDKSPEQCKRVLEICEVRKDKVKKLTSAVKDRAESGKTTFKEKPNKAKMAESENVEDWL